MRRLTAILALGLAALGLATLACGAGPAFADGEEDYPCGPVRLRVATVSDPEDQHVVVRILGGSGAVINAPGDFVPLCAQRKFLLLDTSLERAPKESWLMSAAGERVAQFEFGYVAGFGSEADDKLFWVQGFVLTETGTATRLRVVDSNGQGLVDKIYEKGAVEPVSIGGQTIEIGVLEPEKPSYLTRPAATP